MEKDVPSLQEFLKRKIGGDLSQYSLGGHNEILGYIGVQYTKHYDKYKEKVLSLYPDLKLQFLLVCQFYKIKPPPALVKSFFDELDKFPPSKFKELMGVTHGVLKEQLEGKKSWSTWCQCKWLSMKGAPSSKNAGLRFQPTAQVSKGEEKGAPSNEKKEKPFESTAQVSKGEEKGAPTNEKKEKRFESTAQLEEADEEEAPLLNKLKRD